jgi:hypothetical protein
VPWRFLHRRKNKLGFQWLDLQFTQLITIPTGGNDSLLHLGSIARSTFSLLFANELIVPPAV